MTIQKEVAPDMVWLTKGEEDPHKDYQTRTRADLPMADFSDDQLANYAFMHYDRDKDVEVAMMITQHQGKDLPEFRTRIAFMTAVKERIRWLSRQLAIAEGRIPDPKAIPKVIPDVEVRAKEIYDGWRDDPKWCPWVEGGNSIKQDEARDLARRELNRPLEYIADEILAKAHSELGQG